MLAEINLYVGSVLLFSVLQFYVPFKTISAHMRWANQFEEHEPNKYSKEC